MNERIDELMIEAGARFEFLHGVHYDDFQYKKFAESIVQECMDAVREQYLPVLEDEVMMKDTHWDGYVQCGVDSYVAIKQRFGVSND